MKTLHIYLAAGMAVVALLGGGSVAGFYVAMAVHDTIIEQNRSELIRQETARLQSMNEINERMKHEKFNFESRTPTPSPTVAATPVPLTLIKPIDVKLKYGNAKLPAGMKLQIISRNGSKFVADYAGEQIEIPVESTDFHP